MSRHQWLHAQWPESLKETAKRLRSAAFQGERSHGFIVDRTREKYVEARYIERVAFTETVTDPFGIESTYDRVYYNQCQFRASSDYPGLELMDMPRRVSGLMSLLSEIHNFNVAISPLQTDVLLWTESFQNIVQEKIVVESLQIGSLQIAEGIVAKTIIKGDSDVRAASERFLDHRQYKVEKVQVRFNGKLKGKLVLSCAGSARVDAVHTEPILVALRECVSSMPYAT